MNQPAKINMQHLVAEHAERRIVGACMTWGANAVGRLTVTPLQFSNSLLREMVTFAIARCADDQPFDLVATALHLKSIGRPLKEASILCTQLMDEGAFPQTLPYECDQVRAAYSRRMAHTAANSLRIALEAGNDAEAAAMASRALDAINGASGASSGPVSIGDAAAAAFAKSERARISGIAPGITTKLTTLHAKIGGFQAGKAYFIGGRPGHGKTVLLMDILTSAGTQGKSALVFSLEMSATQLAGRSLATVSGVTAQRIERGEYSAGDSARVMDAVETLRGVKLHIDDRAALTIPQITAACRVHQARHGLDIIGIDYAQLATPPKGVKGEEALAGIVKGLNVLKKIFNCPVIILAQPNRQCDFRADRRPMMADFHGSSEFEKAADLILFVYREAAYPDRPEADPSAAEFIIPKNRGGTCGVLHMRWDGPRQTFNDALAETTENYYGC